MNKHMAIGTLVLFLSLALVVVMMPLLGWRSNCFPGESKDPDGNTCIHFGLREYEVGGGSKRSIDSSRPEYEGGTIILATGIIAIVLFVASLVLLCVAHRQVLGQYRIAALGGLYVSAGLLVLGIVLYAYKLNAGYSFILMTVAGFCYYIGIGFLFGGGWKLEKVQQQQMVDEH